MIEYTYNIMNGFNKKYALNPLNIKYLQLKLTDI